MKIGSLFSGIGGLELGLEWAGLGPVIWQVEKDPFCRRVLEMSWPDVERFEDVTALDPRRLHHVDLICGGFPCQDISSAGKGGGLTGSRSGLWFEYARIIEAKRPRWVVVENVASGAKRWVDQVCNHLERIDYDVVPVPLSAKDVGAPHLRRRIFIIAHTDSPKLRQQSGWCGGPDRESAAQPSEHGEERTAGHPDRDSQPIKPKHEQMAGVQSMAANPSPWASFPEICRVDDGIPNRVDRLRALGNAVVPQCAEVIGWMIRELDTPRTIS